MRYVCGRAQQDGPRLALMTGIAAVFDTSASAQGKTLAPDIDAMLARMAGRGRDGLQSWEQGGLALGAALLTTSVALGEEEQPCVNEDTTIAAVFDGYLANWEELRSDLQQRGARMRGHSDVELALRAYECWGEECAQHFDGEFALIVADTRSNQLYCARDHQGLRPLFHARNGNTFVVASDIAAVLAALPQRPTLNEDFLVGALAHQFYLPNATVWSGVELVEQAHWMRISNKGLRTGEYWVLPTDVSIRYAKDEDYVAHYREVLSEAVRRCARTQMPLAMAVSGGLDSSSLFALAHELATQGRLAVPEIQAFCLAAEPDSDAYELPFARAVTDHVGAELNEVALFEPGIEWFQAQSKRDFDLPVASNCTMNIGIERQLVANGSRVYINGDGGDQWLDGNAHYYPEHLSHGDFSGFFRSLSGDARALGWGETMRRAARMTGSWAAPQPIRSSWRFLRGKEAHGPGESAKVLTGQMRERLAEQYRAFCPDIPSNSNAWIKHMRHYSPRTQVFRTMMQRQRGLNGLEARHPMLSRKFVEFCAQTPEHIRMRGEIRRWVHREAMRGVLPEEVRTRNSKANFPSPALDLEFAQSISGTRAQSIAAMCDLEELEDIIRASQQVGNEDVYSWDIWSAFAVAEMLDRSREINPA